MAACLVHAADPARLQQTGARLAPRRRATDRRRHIPAQLGRCQGKPWEGAPPILLNDPSGLVQALQVRSLQRPPRRAQRLPEEGVVRGETHLFGFGFAGSLQFTSVDVLRQPGASTQELLDGLVLTDPCMLRPAAAGAVLCFIDAATAQRVMFSRGWLHRQGYALWAMLKFAPLAAVEPAGP